jgi:hypothetical protein
MPNVLINDSTMTDIANAIRNKTSTTTKMKPSEMASKISSIVVNTGSDAPKLQSKSATPSKSTQSIVPDAGYDGLSSVEVTPIPDSYIVPSGTLEVKTNGTHDVKYYASVNVAVESVTEPEVIGIPYTLPAGLMYGDVNMDGYITEEDYELLHAHSLNSGGVITDATALILADINLDGSISSKDYKAVKEVYLQEKQPSSYGGDYLNNWSVSDDWGTDFSKRFYVDIAVSEATENKLAVITADVDIAENDFKALCGNGTIRIYAKNLPLNSLAVTINMKEKSTNIFLQEKVIAPSEVEQIITPDDGYEGFSQVKISAIPAGDDSGSGDSGDSSGSGDGLPDVIVAGDTPILGSWVGKTVSTTDTTDTGLSVTIPKNGTYRLYIPATKSSGMGSSGSPTITVYKNGVATDKVVSVTSTTPTTPYSIDVECTEGDVIGLYATGYKASYSTTSVTVMALIACIDK